MTNGHITAKQARFCREYIKDNNGTQAAIRAGYSKNGARVRAARLLANSNIAARIQRHEDRATEKAIVDKAEVLKELKKIAFSDLAEYLEYDTSGNITLKPSTELPPELTAAIAEIKQRYDSQGNVRSMDFKLHDKLTALDKLARHLNLYGDDKTDDNGSGITIQNFGPTLILNREGAEAIKP